MAADGGLEYGVLSGTTLTSNTCGCNNSRGSVECVFLQRGHNWFPDPRWAQTRMAAPVPVACVGVVWAGNGWGGKRLKAAGLTGGAVSTLGGGQQPVKCAIPDQWSPNNAIVRRKRPASVQGPVLGRCCLALNITARTRARRYFLMMNCKPVFPTSCHFKPMWSRTVTHKSRIINMTLPFFSARICVPWRAVDGMWETRTHFRLCLTVWEVCGFAGSSMPIFSGDDRRSGPHTSGLCSNQSSNLCFLVFLCSLEKYPQTTSSCEPHSQILAASEFLCDEYNASLNLYSFLFDETQSVWPNHPHGHRTEISLVIKLGGKSKSKKKI